MNNKRGIASLGLAMVCFLSLFLPLPPFGTILIPIFFGLALALGIDACKVGKEFHINIYGVMGAFVGAVGLFPILFRLLTSVGVFGILLFPILYSAIIFINLYPFLGREIHVSRRTAELAYTQLGKVSLGLGVIGLAIIWNPWIAVYLDTFVFGPAATILGAIAVWKGDRGYGLIGILLGILLTFFWVINPLGFHD